MGVDRPFYSCHFLSVLIRRRCVLEAEELLDDLGVLRRKNLVGVQAALALARLHFQVVAHAGLLLHDLAGAGDLETLLGPGMGLLLGHSSLLVGWCVRYSAGCAVTDGATGAASAAGAAGASRGGFA